MWSGRTLKIKLSHDGMTVTDSAIVEGFGPELDGRIDFYSPLAAVIYQQAVEAWNCELTKQSVV